VQRIQLAQDVVQKLSQTHKAIHPSFIQDEEYLGQHGNSQFRKKYCTKSSY
jgi:hypothetical protein